MPECVYLFVCEHARVRVCATVCQYVYFFASVSAYVCESACVSVCVLSFSAREPVYV